MMKKRISKLATFALLRKRPSLAKLGRKSLLRCSCISYTLRLLAHFFVRFCLKYERLLCCKFKFKSAASKLWICVFAIVLPLCCAANTVYRSVDKQGNPAFSDAPTKGAQEVDLPPIQSYSTSELPPETPALRPPQVLNEGVSYASIDIISPAPEETIWSNQGIITITVEVDPSMQPPDQLQLLLDGEVVAASGRSGTFQLSGVERGEHALAAQIVDTEGNVLISSTGFPVFLHKTVSN